MKIVGPYIEEYTGNSADQVDKAVAEKLSKMQVKMRFHITINPSRRTLYLLLKTTQQVYHQTKSFLSWEEILPFTDKKRGKIKDFECIGRLGDWVIAQSLYSRRHSPARSQINYDLDANF